MAKSSLVILFSLFACVTSDENQLQKQEDDPTYEQFQNVQNMIEQQKFLYMLYRTYNTSRNYDCQYIKFGAKSGLTYPETILGYRVPTKPYSETITVTVAVKITPYSGPIDGSIGSRSTPNTLVYKKVSEDGSQEDTQHEYSLIYADSNQCAVMRDPQQDGGYGCEMLVSDTSSKTVTKIVKHCIQVHVEMLKTLSGRIIATQQFRKRIVLIGAISDGGQY
uniref:Putative 22.5 kDa secreted protein n=2 Tax=Ixodes ricinus TaxID=34613 RepID=A0A090XDW5_IXORI